jgi:N-methylhydantoinase B/oxoprolinase/acetone carboxylase alpha subunit
MADVMTADAPGEMGADDDGVTLQIQWSRLISIMDEADIALLHSAFSTIVSDSRDYAVILLDSQARSIAQAQVCVPHFTCSLPQAARTMLKMFPPETLVEGDVLFTNDPWICHGHLPDFYTIAPIFANGRIIAYYACAAHIADIAGRMDELTARDVYEEGFRIPPCKLYEAGRPNELLLRILEANTRQARLVLGDLGAMVGAGTLVGERCREFLADYGPESLDQVARAILERSERAMRAAITAMPDGVYRHAVDCDGFKIPTHIELTLTVAGDTILLDYTGSSLQRADASVNCVPNVTFAHSVFAIKCMLLPNLPNNEGLFRPVTAYAPEGSILNAKFPAPVRARSMTSFHLHSAIFGALVDIMPYQVQAGAGSFWFMGCNGEDAQGRSFSVHVLPNGGTGALNGVDGHSTMAFPGNGTLTPIEIIENRAPLLVHERALWEDSGGAGRNRGGLGQVIRLGTLREASARFTLRPDKMRFPAPGLAGGRDGAAGELWLDDAPLPLDPFTLLPRQILTLKLPGGGGFGDPRERDPDLLRRDLQRGLVSPAAAASEYGYEDGE